MAKILLVEDNEMNRDMLSRRLARRGFEVVIAVDGEEGVSLARTVAPDIILMDMSLPKIDGWEATRQLKADETTRHVPVIARQPMPWRETGKRRFRPGAMTMTPSPSSCRDFWKRSRPCWASRNKRERRWIQRLGGQERVERGQC